MEIRHALALEKPMVLLHGESRAAGIPFESLPSTEADARHGSFDFCSAREQAEEDLQQLLDNTESLPFRRRGYERDGVSSWRTVVS